MEALFSGHNVYSPCIRLDFGKDLIFKSLIFFEVHYLQNDMYMNTCFYFILFWNIVWHFYFSKYHCHSFHSHFSYIVDFLLCSLTLSPFPYLIFHSLLYSFFFYLSLLFSLPSSFFFFFLSFSFSFYFFSLLDHSFSFSFSHSFFLSLSYSFLLFLFFLSFFFLFFFSFILSFSLYSFLFFILFLFYLIFFTSLFTCYLFPFSQFFLLLPFHHHFLYILLWYCTIWSL